jgi:hypothetical protein
VISYLGDDERVIRALHLDVLKGTTMKMATDHSDLIYTMYDVVSRLLGHEMKPTHQRGRNLMELGHSLLGKKYEEQVKKLDESNWVGLSFLTHQLDYRRGAKNLKVHPADPGGAHLYHVVSYPTCLKLKDDPEMKVGGPNVSDLYKEMFEYLNVENHLTSLNKVYSYGFRDGACIEKGNCTFPGPNEDFRATSEGLWIAFLFIPLLVAFITSIALISGWALLKWTGICREWTYLDLSADSDLTALCDIENGEIVEEHELEL